MASFGAGILCEYPMGHAISDTGEIGAMCAEPAVCAVAGREPGKPTLWAPVCNEHLDDALSEMKKLRRLITHHRLGDGTPY